MSPVRKVALLGWPIGTPVIASMSSGARPISSIRWITVIIDCTPMRLPMKLGVSLAQTMPLPSASLPHASQRALAAAEVSGPATSSRSFM